MLVVEITECVDNLSRCMLVLAIAASIFSSFINWHVLNFQNLRRQSAPAVIDSWVRASMLTDTTEPLCAGHSTDQHQPHWWTTHVELLMLLCAGHTTDHWGTTHVELLILRCAGHTTDHWRITHVELLMLRCAGHTTDHWGTTHVELQKLLPLALLPLSLPRLPLLSPSPRLLQLLQPTLNELRTLFMSSRGLLSRATWQGTCLFIGKRTKHTMTNFLHSLQISAYLVITSQSNPLEGLLWLVS